jgi:hypothetical protein
MSISAFGERHRALWRQAGYLQKEANRIIDYQLFCLLEMPLGFVASVILVVVTSVLPLSEFDRGRKSDGCFWP